MTGLSILGYVGIFVGATLLSLLLVPLAMRIAVRLEILDHPGGYKQQHSPVPYLGGVAIIVSFAASILASTAIRPPVTGLRELAVVLGAAVALGVVGLLDDLWSLPLWPRLMAMFAAGGALWIVDVRVQLFHGGILDLLITLLWVVGITNAFNLLDNMDGLSAGVAVVASASFFLIAAANGQFLVAALSLALAGAAVGFLRHNRFPARIYMGDAGSLFIGFMLAVVGLKLRFEAPREITAFVPILVLGVAIFDTALVTVSRVNRGVNPFRGGRDHVSHRMVQLGASARGAVLTIHLAGFALGWLALVMSRLRDVLTAYLLLGLVMVAAGFAARRLADAPVATAEERGTSPAPPVEVADISAGAPS